MAEKQPTQPVSAEAPAQPTITLDGATRAEIEQRAAAHEEKRQQALAVANYHDGAAAALRKVLAEAGTPEAEPEG
jgi:hypothetical protein